MAVWGEDEVLWGSLWRVWEDADGLDLVRCYGPSERSETEVAMAPSSAGGCRCRVGLYGGGGLLCAPRSTVRVADVLFSSPRVGQELANCFPASEVVSRLTEHHHLGNSGMTEIS